MKNEKRWGCLGAILVICFIGVNTFLFTGMKWLNNIPVAWGTLLFAMAVDVVVVGFIINWVIKHISKRNDTNNIDYINFFDRDSTVNSHSYSLNEEFTDLQLKDMTEKEQQGNCEIKIEERHKPATETDDRSTDLTQDYLESTVKSENEDNSERELAFRYNTEQQDLQLERYNLVSCLFMLYHNRVEKEVLMNRLYIDLLTMTNDLKRQADEKHFYESPNNNAQIIAPAWVKTGVHVRHHLYGKGTVKSIEGKIATIVFGGLIKEYAFPDAFDQGILKQVKAEEEQAVILKLKPTENTRSKSIGREIEKSDVTESQKTVIAVENKTSIVSESSTMDSELTDIKKKPAVSWGKVELDNESRSAYKAQPIAITSPPSKKKASGKSKVNWNKVLSDIRHVSAKNNPIYPKGFYSKESPGFDKQQAQSAYQFYQQACILKDISGNFRHFDYHDYPIRSFEFIDIDELKHYISWRTSFETGACAMKGKFFNLYINEIINHLRGFDKTKEHLQKIIALIWDNYHFKYGKIHNAVWENNTLRYVEEYRDRVYLLPEIKRFLTDYYVLSNYPVSAIEFNEMLPESIRSVPKSAEEPQSTVYSDSLELLDSISDYHFLDKAFYKSEYGYLLPQAIDFVFAEIEKYLKAKRINWNQAVFHTKEKDTREWFPFSNFVCYPGERLDDRYVELVNGDTYVIQNGKCRLMVLPNNPNPYSGAIGYTIKLIDNGLRKALGFRAKLQTNNDSVTWTLQRFQDSKLRKKYEKKLNIFTTAEYEELIRNATNQFFDTTGIDRMIMSVGYKKRKEAERRKAERAKEQEKKKAEREKKKLLEKIALETGQAVTDVVLKPTVVEFDKSKFADIRKISEEIQAVLIIEEDETKHDDFMLDEKAAAEVPVIDNTEKSPDEELSDNEFVLLIRSLSEIEKDVLSQIIDGNPAQCISSYLIQHNDTLESAADRINQKSLDMIGDNLIELTDQLYVYEDYFDEITRALEERK